MPGPRDVARRLRAGAADPSKLMVASADLVGRGLERAFVPIDQRLMRRNRNLATIPWRADRRGGKVSYGEWAWLIGLMQGLMAPALPRNADVRILDVGCGTGLVSLAALPLLSSDSRCLGIDVKADNIEFCRRRHRDPRLEFELLDVHNAVYAPERSGQQVRYPVDDDSCDLVTALSVFTHLDPITAAASLAEVARVLRPGGRALITFFVDEPHGDLPLESRFHRTRPAEWVFDVPVEPGWTTPSWTTVPEQAIALDRPTLDRLAEAAGLSVTRHHPGYWREVPGPYFQDVVEFSTRP